MSRSEVHSTWQMPRSVLEIFEYMADATADLTLDEARLASIFCQSSVRLGGCGNSTAPPAISLDLQCWILRRVFSLTSCHQSYHVILFDCFEWGRWIYALMLPYRALYNIYNTHARVTLIINHQFGGDQLFTKLIFN